MNKKIFEKKITAVFCFFHYIKSIRTKMQKLNLTKNKLNKRCYEVLKNIEILSFISGE